MAVTSMFITARPASPPTPLPDWSILEPAVTAVDALLSHDGVMDAMKGDPDIDAKGGWNQTGAVVNRDVVADKDAMANRGPGLL